MNRIFGLFLLALACWAPDVAQAAARFAVCSTTCTWDNTSTAMWSTSSGGATGASAPASGDDVTLDAATCVGGTTCTITTFSGTISINSLNMSACTASTSGCILNASANNTNVTINVSSGGNGFISTGSGTRTLNMGNGTWTMAGTDALFTTTGASNFTLNANGSTLSYTGSGSRTFDASGRTLNIVSVAATGSGGVFAITASTTIGTLNIAAPNIVRMNQGNTATITTLNVTGASPSAGTLFVSSNLANNATFAVTNNFTGDWCGFAFANFTVGTHSATNSFKYNNVTGITVTPPSAGGGTTITVGGFGFR